MAAPACRGAAERRVARFAEIQADCELALEDVRRAVGALEGAHLIQFRQAEVAARSPRVVKVSGEARRIVGAWPSPESGAQRLLAALDDMVQGEQQPDRKRLLQKLRTAAGSVSHDVIVEVVTRMLTDAATGS